MVMVTRWVHLRRAAAGRAADGSAHLSAPVTPFAEASAIALLGLLLHRACQACSGGFLRFPGPSTRHFVPPGKIGAAASATHPLEALWRLAERRYAAGAEAVAPSRGDRANGACGGHIHHECSTAIRHAVNGLVAVAPAIIGLQRGQQPELSRCSRRCVPNLADATGVPP